jgi:AraC-like DNA-binding protein
MKAGVAVSPELELIVPQPDQSFRWVKHDYPFSISWSYHPEFELHLIQESSGILFCGDYVGEFAPGHLSLIGPNVPHQWASNLSPGETIMDRDVLLQFQFERIENGRTAFPEFAEILALLDTARQGVEFTGRAAGEGARLLLQLETLSGLPRLLAFFELFLALARSPESERKQLASANYQNVMSSQHAGAVGAIISYVVDNLAGEIRLARAAEVANMSESSMSRFFRRSTGMGFTEYVRKLRIGLACRLLAETNREIVEISSEVGYENLSNFNRSFLREKGMTPSKYRKSVRLLSVEMAACRSGKRSHP